jgi:WXG100 family type VII secretion target
MTSSPGSPGFGVDLDDLDAVVSDVAACERGLTGLAADLARETALLHEAWSGLAADAQLAAQADCDRALRATHDALTRLRTAARAAHGHYTAAAQANLADWSAVS